MRPTSLLIAVATLPLIAACGGSSGGTAAPPASPLPQSPAASPPSAGRGWVAVIDNPWLPLTPGSRWVWLGRDGGQPTRDVQTIDTKTRLIDGVHATIAHDNLYTRTGRPLEKTDDYYAQDGAGNVWYMGEDTAELDKNGNVKSRGGSWRSGVKGAHAGIIMYAETKLGASYAQENFPGKAEDHAKIIDLSASVRVPAARSAHALETMEFSPLEPHVIEHKYYIRGIGDTYDNVVKGPREFSRLVSYTTGR